MKTKIIVALVAAAALCAITYFVVANGISNPPIPKDKTAKIIGSWQIDTVYAGKDSNNLALLAYALLDSATIFKFNADSTLQTISPKENTTQYYVLNKDSLIVKQDSTLETSLVKFENDSSFSITSKDNTVLVLKRILSK